MSINNSKGFEIFLKCYHVGIENANLNIQWKLHMLKIH